MNLIKNMPLTKEQTRQVRKQILDHRHEKHEVDIDLDANTVIENFAVFSNVLRPDRVIGLYLARYLYSNPKIYKNKVVLDMGSGTGLLGITAGICGAKKILFSDITEESFQNSTENVRRFKLKQISKIYKGDLFENLKGKVDVIIFNHPFFPDNPIIDEPISIALLDDGGLIQRFLSEAKYFLKDDGVIIMPYYHLAGPINNPSIQAEKYGYISKEVFECDVPSGLKKGIMSIYEINIK